MGIHIGDNKIVIITEPRTIYFDLHKEMGIDCKVWN